METRSQRQQASRRPAYPQVSTSNTSTTLSSQQSSASSLFQRSSSSVASVPSPDSAGMMISQTGQQERSAPLPSPLGAQPASNYFGSIAANTNAQSSSTYVGQRGGDVGGVPETAPYLGNFNLVAEAAKRAQMACLMRDLGDVEL